MQTNGSAFQTSVGTAGFEPAVYRYLRPLQGSIIHVAVSAERFFALEPVALPFQGEILSVVST